MFGILRSASRVRAQLAALAAAGLVAAGVIGLAAAPAHAATSITINGASSGRTLDGIGAVSGGGGNSRLLIDYPEPQRTQILDYLFKPGYGAALQMLKVEIGGDANSTSGAEPSFEHSRGQINCNAGYEFWIMQQAKARNPNIEFVGLAWAAPGWISGGFLSTDTINYLISWLGCAKQDGVPVDYLGATQNERTWSVSWTISLRNALNTAGYSNVKLIVGDQYPGWVGATDVSSNPTFANAVSVLSAHYPCGYLGAQSTCTVPSNVSATGKTLWASENGSQDYNGGAQALARGLNRDYIDGKMTAYLNWDLIAAITPNLPWNTVGLMVANQPWSGNYALGKNLWTIAQTAQFTAPGWQYLDSSSGYIAGNRNNGSYVSLKSANNSDYSTIIETMDASGAQTLNFNVTGGLSTGQVHVWSTNLSSSNSADYMVHATDITPAGGAFSLTVQPGYIYSITTTTGQGKGTAASPASGSLNLPYSDSFDSYAAGGEPKYLQALQGSFEAQPCGGGRTGMCVRQDTPVVPINWKPNADPYAIGGNLNWTNYTLSSDVLLEQSGYAELIGRANSQNLPNPCGLNAYYLRVSDTGAWSILRNDTNCNVSTLRSGSVSALGTGRWHALGLTFSGSTITASIDGNQVGTANDSTYSAGQVGYGTSQYTTQEFDNLQVTAPGQTGNTVTVSSPGAQSGSVGAAVAPVQVHATDSAAGQTLTYSATGLPAGLSISASGLISGTPTASGTFNVTVTATDTTGASGSASFAWSVSGGGGGGGSTCQVSYTKNEWTGGFTANVTVANNGTTAVDGWTLKWAFPGDQKITNAWNAAVTQSGTSVTATNLSYNAAIPPGGNVQFGFQGTWASNDTNPTTYTLNGTACS